jgi:hypothetical protein
METYHCPECKKAATRERIQLAPWFAWLGYLGFAPQPIPHNGVVFTAGLLLLSLVCVQLYYSRHP